MNCDDIKRPLGVAIAELEEAKLALLEVFRWGSQPGMFKDGEPGMQAMQVAMVQTMLPAIDLELSKAFQALTGNPLPHHVTFVEKEKDR